MSNENHFLVYRSMIQMIRFQGDNIN